MITVEKYNPTFILISTPILISNFCYANRKSRKFDQAEICMSSCVFYNLGDTAGFIQTVEMPTVERFQVPVREKKCPGQQLTNANFRTLQPNP